MMINSVQALLAWIDRLARAAQALATVLLICIVAINTDGPV